MAVVLKGTLPSIQGNYFSQGLTVGPKSPPTTTLSNAVEASHNRFLTNVQNLQTAQYLLFSSQDPTTANRAINPMFHGGYFADGLMTTSYLTDPQAYFAQSTVSHDGFTFYQRVPFTIQELPLIHTIKYKKVV